MSAMLAQTARVVGRVQSAVPALDDVSLGFIGPVGERVAHFLRA